MILEYKRKATRQELIGRIEELEREIEELKEKDNYWKANAIPKNTINYLYVSKDKIRELVAKHKLEYEEQWCSDGTYYKFAKDVKELLEE